MQVGGTYENNSNDCKYHQRAILLRGQLRLFRTLLRLLHRLLVQLLSCSKDIVRFFSTDEGLLCLADGGACFLNIGVFLLEIEQFFQLQIG